MDDSGHPPKPAPEAFDPDSDVYRRIFEDSAFCMTVTAPSGQFLMVNQAFADFLGYTVEEVLDLTVSDVTHPEDRAATSVARDKTITGDSPSQQIEKRYIRKDGMTVWGLMDRSVVRDDHGNVRYVIAQIQNIDRLKSAQVAVTESEQRLRHFLQAAAERFWETDENHRYVFVSESPEADNRFDIADMIGKTRWELDPDDEDAPHWQEYRKLVESHEPFRDFEYTRIRPTGDVFRIRTSAVPILDEFGKFKGYRGVNREVSRDVIDKEVAEQQARAIQQQFFETLEQLDAGVVVWSQENTFVYCNPSYKGMQVGDGKLLVPGYSYKDHLRRQLEDEIVKVPKEAWDDWVEARLSDFENETIEYDIEQEEGRWFRVLKQRFEDGSHMSIHMDISHRKNVERLKDEFISLASHELRTPLTSIRGSLGLMLQGVAGEMPEASKGMLEIAHRNCERLSTLINDFLDMSKIESGEFGLNLEAVDIDPLLTEVIELNSPYADQYGCTFKMANWERGMSVEGDPSRLNQVITNLLSNAAKFSPEGTDVEISAVASEGLITISVSDHGSGVPHHFRDHLFEKFSQADNADSKSKYGTGLGLSISKSIVEMHGGKIGYEPNEDEGSTFWFSLPVTRQ